MSAAEAVEALRRLIRRLRGPGGCPWDREQTPASMVRYLLEEAHELADAVASGDEEAVREELGDVLFQVLFLGECYEEEGRFDLEAVCRGITEKMTRRHPHVFGTARAADSSEVLRNWRRIKKEEKGGAQESASRLDRLPAGLPALLRAQAVGERAAAAGFDWEHPEGVLAKLEEEWSEFRAARASADPAALEREIGDLLFTLVNLARRCGVSADGALRGAVQKFERRFRSLETRLAAQGRRLEEAPQAEKDRLWEEIKAGE